MWKIKVLIQFVLAALPFGEKANFLLQVKRGSHCSDKVAGHLIKLAEKVGIVGQHVQLDGSNVVEIGTGWDAGSAILFYLMGVKNCYTYDHKRHVRFQLVKKVINQLEVQYERIASLTGIEKNVLKRRLNELKKANTLDSLFENAKIIYCAPGDAGKTGLSEGSIDLVYAYAVLEHVPESVIAEILIETKRILKGGGELILE